MPAKAWRGRLSPLPGLPPGARPGLRRQRPAAPWAAVAALAAGLLGCLLLLLSVQGRLEGLREELAGLRTGLRCEAAGTAADPRQSPDGGPVPHALRARWKRDVGKSLQEQPPRHRKEDGGTEIWWAPFLHQGRALQPSGQDVVVKHTGLYFVYSQVLFHDPTFTMGQVLRRVAPGKPDQILFRCVQSMPHKLEKAYNSCYSGGVFHLQQGDRLSLRIPRFNASFDVSAHGTFLGVLSL